MISWVDREFDTPYDWEPVYPKVGEVVMVGDRRAVVVAHADQQDLHPLIEDGGHEVVVSVTGESELRSVALDEIYSYPEEP